MPQHLLPCACGNQVPVAPTDAGLEVACTCGARLKVPNTRSILALPILPTGESAPAKTRHWGLMHQLLALGITCVVLGSGLLIYQLSHQPENPSASMVAELMEGRTVSGVVDLWIQIRKLQGMEPMDTKPMHKYVEERDDANRKIVLGGIVTVIGAAATIAAFCVPRR